jgi:hypothetical protein
MELAERMYGVTMAEPGISSVIGADLTPATADTVLVGEEAPAPAPSHEPVLAR